MVDTPSSDEKSGSPVVMLVMGALAPSGFVAVMSLMLWVSTRNAEGALWFAAIGTGLMLVASAVHMIAQKWSPDRVAVFVTCAGTAMGVGYAGMTLLQNGWWMMGGFGVMFVAMLVTLFTNLDDRVKLWGVIAAMTVPALIVAAAFSWIAAAAGLAN